MRKALSVINIRTVFIISSIILFLPNILNSHLVEIPYQDDVSEQFEPLLVAKVRSVDDLLTMADSMADAINVKQHTLDYAEILTKLVRERFYHGYSHYSLQENWLAALSGVTIWNHLSAIVLPDDLLKYPMAACSQQSIVLAACFKKKGFDYRKVGFDHHFALEAKVGSQWIYFDPNLEPDFSNVHRNSLDTLVKQGALYEIYKARLDSSTLEWGLSGIHFGEVNESLASRASLFHVVTKIASKSFFFVPLLFLLISTRRARNSLTLS